MVLLESDCNTQGEILRTRGVAPILGNTELVGRDFRVYAGVFSPGAKVVEGKIGVDLRQVDAFNEFFGEFIVERQILESQERTVLNKSVGTEPVITVLIKGTGHFGNIPFLTPAPVNGNRLVVVGVHVLGIHAGIVHNLVACAEVEERIDRKILPTHRETETAIEFRITVTQVNNVEFVDCAVMVTSS